MADLPLLLEKGDLSALATEYGLPKLVAGSGPLHGWGNKRLRRKIETTLR